MRTDCKKIDLCPKMDCQGCRDYRSSNSTVIALLVSITIFLTAAVAVALFLLCGAGK